MQCLRVGSTINRGPPDTNFVGESNPTSQTLNTLTPKIEHARSPLSTILLILFTNISRLRYYCLLILTIIYNIIYIILNLDTNIDYNFFLHFGTPRTEGGVVRLSNSAASTAAVGTTERELLRETLIISSPTVEEDLFTLQSLAPELARSYMMHCVISLSIVQI